MPPPSLRDTSPKYDSKITLANPNLHVGFGGARWGRVWSARRAIVSSVSEASQDE